MKCTLCEKSMMLTQQEIANYGNLSSEYLSTLKEAFPQKTKEELSHKSTVLQHIRSRRIRAANTLKLIKEKSYSLHYFGLTDATLEAVRKRSQKYTHDTFIKAAYKMLTMYGGSWGMPTGIDREYMDKTNTIPMALWFVYFDRKTGQVYRSKERGYWLDSFLLKPKFKSGDIVSIRSNIPDNSFKYEHDWGNGISDLRTKYVDTSFKAKTFMIIGEDNKNSRYHDKAYKPNAQGGMRRYKLLPIGDTRVYWAIERALKINRTKAVKDAKAKKNKKT